MKVASYISSITQAMDYVHAINSPWFQLYSDFAYLCALGYDVLSELEKGKGHFVAIHVKDANPVRCGASRLERVV